MFKLHIAVVNGCPADQSLDMVLHNIVLHYETILFGVRGEKNIRIGVDIASEKWV
tara:strand:- start:93 stop:257 length:165 start_codon:yes stop_codon:yes gene_type:complete